MMKLLRRRSAIATASFFSLVCASAALPARADDAPPSKAPATAGPESPKPVVGKAPFEGPSEPVKAEPAAPSDKIFDTEDLGAPDPAAVALLEKIEKECYAEPRSREGMTPAEERRCNLAVSRLVGLGKKAVPAIFARLDVAKDEEHYYARTRLYHALGKSDDPKVEDLLLRGYARIATKKLDGYSLDMTMIEDALITMNGTDPAGAALIGKKDVADEWATAEDAVIAWRLWQRDHASTPKNQVRKDALARARTDATSKDLKVVYQALMTLAELAPNEGLEATNKLLDREDIDGDDKGPFYAITSRAYTNGAVERAEPEPPPKVVKVKAKSKETGKASTKKAAPKKEPSKKTSSKKKSKSRSKE